jgi:hypothetical protein
LHWLLQVAWLSKIEMEEIKMEGMHEDNHGQWGVMLEQ